MHRRSFALNDDDLDKIEAIKNNQAHKTQAETLRYCIDFAFKQLFVDPTAKLLFENNQFLRVILTQHLKAHFDASPKNLSPAAKDFLAELKKHINKKKKDIIDDFENL